MNWRKILPGTTSSPQPGTSPPSLSAAPFFESLTDRKNELWFVLLRLIIFGLVIFAYSLPEPYRSLSYLTGMAALIAYSFLSWPRTWMIILFLIPALEMAPPLFNSPKLLPHRFLLVAAVITLFLNWKPRKHLLEILQSPVFLAFLSFIAANIVSALNARSLEAFFRSLTYFEPLLYFGLTWALIFLYQQPLKKLILNLLLGGACVQAIGLIEVITQKSFRELLSIPGPEALPALMAENRFGIGGRIASTLSHPVYAGLYFLLLLILSLYFFYQFQSKQKRLLALLVPLNMFLILATGTRAVILGFVLSLFTFFFFLKERKNFLPVLAGGLILFIFFLVLFPQLPLYFQKSLKLMPHVQEASNIRYRIALTKTFLQVFKEKPLLGNGPGLIQKEALRNENSKFRGMSGIENQYAIILADGGLIAGLAYLIFMLACWFEALKLNPRSPPELSFGRPTLAACLIAYFFFISSETCLTMTPNFVLMALFGGLTARKRWSLRLPDSKKEPN